VNAAAFAAAQEMLGNKLPTILNYYLEDAASYIDRIAESIARHDPMGAVAPAHTLKSSSRQLGAMALADLAEQVETAARAPNNIAEMQYLADLLPTMREALQHVRPFFQLAGLAQA